MDYFRLLFASAGTYVPRTRKVKLVVVQCKGRHENIPAPVADMRAQPDAQP
jgi:hypothetical protein